ncbi:dienelactone hydrolase family protein [Nonomuraea wenchangensis]
MTVETASVGDLPLHQARPMGGITTGVLVLSQAMGYSPQIEAWLTRLAAAGHVAVAPSLLARRGVETVDPMERFGGDIEAFAKFLPGDDELRTDINAALDHLRSAGVEPGSTGVLGWSYGGRAAFLTASEHALGAAISWYATGIQPGFPGNDGLPSLGDRMPRLRTPWLGLFGDQDILLAPGELDELGKNAAQAPVRAEIVRYPAGHAFDIDAPFPPDGASPFVATAAEDATRRTLEFLDSTLR